MKIKWENSECISTGHTGRKNWRRGHTCQVHLSSRGGFSEARLAKYQFNQTGTLDLFAPSYDGTVQAKNVGQTYSSPQAQQPQQILLLSQIQKSKQKQSST